MQNSATTYLPLTAVLASFAVSATSLAANSTRETDYFSGAEANKTSPFRTQSISTQSSWLDGEVANILKIRDQWASFAADPLKLSTVNQIRALLRLLQQNSEHIGRLVPGADGSIQAEWHRLDVSIGLLVESDGSFSSWARFEEDGSQVEEFGAPAIDLFKSLATAYRLNV